MSLPLRGWRFGSGVRFARLHTIDGGYVVKKTHLWTENHNVLWSASVTASNTAPFRPCSRVRIRDCQTQVIDSNAILPHCVAFMHILQHVK